MLDKPTGWALTADRTGAPELWPRLLAHLARTGHRPHLVHRLDKGTSGVLIVARTPGAQKHLTRAFAARAVAKTYLAECEGRWPPGGTWTVDLPLCRGRKGRYRVAGPREAIRVRPHRSGGGTADLPETAIRADGRAARTRFRILSSDGDGDPVTLLARPETGRTHQLRVHLCWLGLPIVGDPLYPRPRSGAGRLRLHCLRLVVPTRRGPSSFHAPLRSWAGPSDPEEQA